MEKVFRILWILGVSAILAAEAQNLDKLCRQVFTDCQACSVYQTECVAQQGRPPVTNRPQQPPRPTAPPTTPVPIVVTQPPRPQCLDENSGCNTSDECCNKNCKVESLQMNGKYYTIKVCRSPIAAG